MKHLITLVLLLSFACTSHAAILVYGTSGVASGVFSNLSSAKTAAGVKRVVVTTPQTLTGNIAWPADRSLEFSEGSYIISGSYALTGLKEARPEWFGAVADGVTPCASAINKAIASLKPFTDGSTGTGGIVRFGVGIYLIDTPITVGSTVFLQGEIGNYGTFIKANTGFTGEALIILNNSSSDYAVYGSGLANMRIQCNGQSAHGIVGKSIKENSRFENFVVADVADGYHAMKIEPNSSHSTGISQSFVIKNAVLQHKNATATQPTLLLDKCQEITLDTVKSFGGYPNVNADSVPIYIRDSRSVTLTGCTSAQTNTNGLTIITSTRFISGIVTINHLFEDVTGICLNVVGTVANSILYITHINPRYEGTIGTGADLTYTSRSLIEVGDEPVVTNTGSQYNRLNMRQSTQYTNTGGLANHPYYYGIAPKTYSVTNLSTLRTYDADATTTEQIADIVGTLIQDLRDRGVVQ